MRIGQGNPNLPDPLATRRSEELRAFHHHPLECEFVRYPPVPTKHGQSSFQ